MAVVSPRRSSEYQVTGSARTLAAPRWYQIKVIYRQIVRQRVSVQVAAYRARYDGRVTAAVDMRGTGDRHNDVPRARARVPYRALVVRHVARGGSMVGVMRPPSRRR